MRSLMEARLFTNRIYAPREKEPADPELLDVLAKDLDAGVDSLRQAGHNIIFAALSLKALRENPELATPGRVSGLRRMVQSFGTNKGPAIPLRNRESYVDISDENKFVCFVCEEYLKALELHITGRGHHGYAGHILTIGHALVDLRRLGYKATAEKGVEAYWQFVQRARNGANLGGKPVEDAPQGAPGPLTRDYWLAQAKRRTPEITSSHILKYPYSFYALAKELRDETLKQRLFERIYHLTAVS
jgi:hypothetical protein